MTTNSGTQTVYHDCVQSGHARTYIYSVYRHTLRAAAFIRGWRLFHSAPPIVRRLFEGGVYLRAASIRGNTVHVVNNWMNSCTCQEYTLLLC